MPTLGWIILVLTLLIGSAMAIMFIVRHYHQILSAKDFERVTVAVTVTELPPLSISPPKPASQPPPPPASDEPSFSVVQPAGAPQHAPGDPLFHDEQATRSTQTLASVLQAVPLTPPPDPLGPGESLASLIREAFKDSGASLRKDPSDCAIVLSGNLRVSDEAVEFVFEAMDADGNPITTSRFHVEIDSKAGTRGGVLQDALLDIAQQTVNRLRGKRF